MGASANIYVWSGATGSNTGDGWANAYTSITSADSVAVANDLIWVQYTHSEEIQGGAVFNTTNASAKFRPVRYFSVDKGNSNNVRPGAQLYANAGLELGTINDTGFALIGVNIKWANTVVGDLSLAQDTSKFFSACEFTLGPAGTSISEFTWAGDYHVSFDVCTFNLSKGQPSNGLIWPHEAGAFICKGGGLDGKGANATYFLKQADETGTLIFRNMDLIGNNATELTFLQEGPVAAEGPVFLKLSNSKVPATFNFPGFAYAEPTSRAEAYSVSSSNNLHGLIISQYYGSVVDDVNTYLNANINATNFSLKYVITGYNDVAPVWCSLGEFWADGNSSIRINMTSNSVITTSEVWLEIEHPTFGSPQLASLVSTRHNGWADSSNASSLATNSETWTNGMNNTYQISHTITNGDTGPHRIRLYATAASNNSLPMHLYVDPEPIIT